MNDRYRYVLRALALTGIASSRLAGCPFPALGPYECYCRGDARTDNPAAVTRYGTSEQYYNGRCTPQDLDGGCNEAPVPGGPLYPPDLAG